MSLRRAGGGLLLLAVSLGLSLVAAEGALRLFDKFTPPGYPPLPRMPELYQAHAGYGYALRPSRTAYYDYPPTHPRRIRVDSDSMGFRNAREFDPTDPRRRILVVGDSYAFGEGVQESERFSDVLEQMVPGWRVDNIGMTGYGPDLMLLALETIAPLARPDVVVITLFYDDFRRVRSRYAGMGYAIPRLRLAGGRLVQVPYPKPRWWERLHLYHGMLLAFSREGKPYRSLDREEWRLNEAIQDSVLALAKAYDFRPLYVYLPGPWTGKAQQFRSEWVKQYAQSHGAAFVDLTGPLQAADPDSVYLPANEHYGPFGHHLVASQLRNPLEAVLDAAPDGAPTAGSADPSGGVVSATQVGKRPMAGHRAAHDRRGAHGPRPASGTPLAARG